MKQRAMKLAWNKPSSPSWFKRCSVSHSDSLSVSLCIGSVTQDGFTADH